MKDNKLIAEFMGMTYGDPNDKSVMIQMTPQGNEVVPIESMEYHTSWDWLMPVSKKIENRLWNVGMVGYFDECLSSNDLEVRYQAVVEFINEYNKNESTD
tara:strand:+ start:89 stop:388 length:300 start_codon:yes stop_codon:yes gene_type:complete